MIWLNNKYKIFAGIGIFLFVGLFTFFGFHLLVGSTDDNRGTLEATVLSKSNGSVIVQDKDNVIYTFEVDDMEVCVGENIILEYTGLLDRNVEIQNVDVDSYEEVLSVNGDSVPSDWQDNGMFRQYYKLAYDKVKNMSLDEKIAQILLVRYPDTNAVNLLKKNQFGGYVFFEKDFSGKTKEEVVKMIDDLQEVADIPILTAVDEEGGKVVRISSNSNLRSEKFASSSSLYAEGGFTKIKEDTIEKSKLLKSLGLNLNLAPVVDVATDSNAYMYSRTLGQNTEITSSYAKTVIQASKGLGVSYTLKHFPGYGNNTDTHISSATDTRIYDEILTTDIPPFQAGIDAGAEAVLVSHNVVSSIDPDNPASLSASVHNLLRNELGFTGIIITDDLAMSAISSIDDAVVKAILAGNDLIITTDYENDMKSIQNAIQNDVISEDMIDKLAMRVIAWKYYKGLLFENQK